jgi:2-polyprenyl-3-methyl-5-hydroxy-6-metoxy-1,4-benzoquinol methylase
MPSFKQRSYKKELLDSDAIPFEDIKRNMEELEFINRRLGGHAITLQGLATLTGKASSRMPLHIVEIGCGRGDNLKAIGKWAAEKNIPVHLQGIDINPECIAWARQQERNQGIEFLQSDYKKVAFTQKPDIIFSSLFCHHFTDEELVFMLSWMRQHSRMGFFINDLHRNVLAYYAIKILTGIFSKSYLVKNDAPLSVLRGFKRKDWTAIFKKAGISQYTCQWKWAFRWLLIYRNGME